MKLQENSEVVGTLQQISSDEIDACFLFTFSKEITVPISRVDVDELKQLVGQKIGLINIDGEIHHRIIKQQGSNP